MAIRRFLIDVEKFEKELSKFSKFVSNNFNETKMIMVIPPDHPEPLGQIKIVVKNKAILAKNDLSLIFVENSREIFSTDFLLYPGARYLSNKIGFYDGSLLNKLEQSVYDLRKKSSELNTLYDYASGACFSKLHTYVRASKADSFHVLTSSLEFSDSVKISEEARIPGSSMLEYAKMDITAGFGLPVWFSNKWELKFYFGSNNNIAIAEINLRAEDEPLVFADWINSYEEVTNDPNYNEENLIFYKDDLEDDF
jgi:hypothetical protein